MVNRAGCIFSDQEERDREADEAILFGTAKQTPKNKALLGSTKNGKKSAGPIGLKSKKSKDLI